MPNAARFQTPNKTARARRGPRLAGWLRRFARLIVLLAVMALLLIGYVIADTQSESYDSAMSAPPEPVAVVFGAGITGKDRLTPMLADRVKTAVELYQLRRVEKILMTGDSGRMTHDEATAMQHYAVARGVAKQDIALDYAGFSTYESCYRARVIFGVRRAILVTQQYHLPRAIYTCRELGIQAVGVGARDWGVYPDMLMTSYSLREGLAILKALWDVHVARPLPTFLGPYEGWQLTGS